MELRTDLLIGGEWVPGAGRFEDVNPATEETIAEVAEAGPDQVDDAVRSARQAFESDEWRGMDPHHRARLLNRLAELIEERASELAEIETRDNGKPAFESSRVDLPSVVENYRYFAGWADKVGGRTIPVSGPFLNYTRREPLGVVGAIVPWNYPLGRWRRPWPAGTRWC